METAPPAVPNVTVCARPIGERPVCHGSSTTPCESEHCGNMANPPLVSIITPVFNAARFVREAIESVLSQTYEHWELLLVDDGSTDASPIIIREYVTRHPGKVRCVEHEGHGNYGASAARNLGIRNARGDYVAFLDADDLWLSQKLERQVMIMNSQPAAAMLYGRTQWWYSWTGNSEDRQRDYTPELGVESDSLIGPPTLLIQFLQGAARVPCTCSVLLRRSVLDETGGFEEEFRCLYDDQALYAKICLRANVFVTGECWDKYRQHPDSYYSAAKKTGERNRARLYYLGWLQAFLSAQGVKDPRIWRALRTKQRRHGYAMISRLTSGARHHVKYMLGRLKSMRGAYSDR